MYTLHVKGVVCRQDVSQSQRPSPLTSFLPLTFLKGVSSIVCTQSFKVCPLASNVLLSFADASITNICSNVRYESTNTYIASPNFPDNYPPNLACSCSVTAKTPGVRVTLEIVYLAIKYNSPCQDWLRVGRKHICGTSSDLFTGTRIPIEFHSDGEESHSGFWLNFKGQHFNLSHSQ